MSNDRRESANWFERHVLDTLDALDKNICTVESGVKELGDAIGGKDGIRERMARIEERTTQKAAVVGALSGALPAIGALIIWYLSR